MVTFLIEAMGWGEIIVVEQAPILKPTVPFLRDVLKLRNVDVGQGWLIFGLPPAEVAVHPSERNEIHEIYLMYNDLRVFMGEMEKNDVDCSPVQDRGWRLLTQLLPSGGGKQGVYQPRHALL